MVLSVAVRRCSCAMLLCLVLAGLLAGPAGARTPVAPATAPPPTAAPPPPALPPLGTPGLAPPAGPRAWVLVDADTGNVINASDDHTPMRPASISKVLTAIVATERLPADAVVPVSPTAAGTESVNLGMKVGQVWTFTDTLHAMLMLSANDAAIALAERVSGTREAFAAEMERTAASLHLVDHPVLRDPAGLDDEFSVGGGNAISAYDLAIIARTALAIPEIRQIVDLPEYRFTAPDGIVHQIGNVDRGLALYPGAIGIKTGHTKAAGDTFMAAAARDGRTMIAVVLQSPNIYRSATALLDLGFATPVASESKVDRLPATSTPVSAPATTTPSVAPSAARGSAVAPPSRHGFFDGWLRDVIVGMAVALLVLAAAVVVLRRRAVRRRRARYRSFATRRN